MNQEYLNSYQQAFTTMTLVVILATIANLVLFVLNLKLFYKNLDKSQDKRENKKTTLIEPEQPWDKSYPVYYKCDDVAVGAIKLLIIRYNKDLLITKSLRQPSFHSKDYFWDNFRRIVSIGDLDRIFNSSLEFKIPPQSQELHQQPKPRSF